MSEVQGYLAHKKSPLGIVLLEVSRGALFLMSEVPLYPCTAPLCPPCSRRKDSKLPQCRASSANAVCTKWDVRWSMEEGAGIVQFEVPLYRSTSLIRNCFLLGPYSRTERRTLQWS